MDLEEFDKKLERVGAGAHTLGNKLILFVTLPILLLFGLAYCAGVRL